MAEGPSPPQVGLHGDLSRRRSRAVARKIAIEAAINEAPDGATLGGSNNWSTSGVEQVRIQEGAESILRSVYEVG
jgi:hypothetical protein